MTARAPLHDLQRFGQSVWLDDLPRRMIRSGELKHARYHLGIPLRSVKRVTIGECRRSGDNLGRPERPWHTSGWCFAIKGQ